MNFIVKKKSFYALCLSLLVAFIVASLPWEVWRGIEYYDRSNYINTIDFSVNNIYIFNFDTLLSKFSNEWLWHKLLAISTETFNLNSSQILFFISFLILFTSCLFLSSRYRFLSILFLMNPLFINFMYSQLRLAFAMSLLFIAFYLFKKNNRLYLILLVATPFIHTSAVIFISVFILAFFLESSKKISPIFKTLLSIGFGAFLGIITGPLMSKILSAMDDRRAEYSDMSSSIVYMSFWLILCLYLILKGLFEKTHKSFSFYLSLMILTLVALQTVVGGYPTRYLVACFPFLIAAMLENKAKEKYIVLLSYCAYTFILWVYWINNG